MPGCLSPVKALKALFQLIFPLFSTSGSGAVIYGVSSNQGPFRKLFWKLAARCPAFVLWRICLGSIPYPPPEVWGRLSNHLATRPPIRASEGGLCCLVSFLYTSLVVDRQAWADSFSPTVRSWLQSDPGFFLTIFQLSSSMRCPELLLELSRISIQSSEQDRCLSGPVHPTMLQALISDLETPAPTRGKSMPASIDWQLHWLEQGWDIKLQCLVELMVSMDNPVNQVLLDRIRRVKDNVAPVFNQLTPTQRTLSHYHISWIESYLTRAGLAQLARFNASPAKVPLL